jgi:hypothetical protein
LAGDGAAGAPATCCHCARRCSASSGRPVIYSAGWSRRAPATTSRAPRGSITSRRVGCRLESRRRRRRRPERSCARGGLLARGCYLREATDAPGRGGGRAGAPVHPPPPHSEQADLATQSRPAPAAHLLPISSRRPPLHLSRFFVQDEASGGSRAAGGRAEASKRAGREKSAPAGADGSAPAAHCCQSIGGRSAARRAVANWRAAAAGW